MEHIRAILCTVTVVTILVFGSLFEENFLPTIEAGGGPIATLTITKLTTGGDDTFDFTVTGPTSSIPSINTAGGMGTFGPISVSPGTYSIQETIPAGWSLTTATCNDGSSSFSADTVSGIVINSDSSVECTFENTFTATPPDQVTGLVATAIGVSTIDLIWNTPSDGGVPITGYTIERESPIGDGFTILVANTGSTETTFEDTDLMPNTQYNYRVSAINTVGTGLVSNEADAITLASPGTLKITKLTTGGDDTFDFTVTGPTSYATSITTSGSSGIDTVNPTLAISSFSDSGDVTQIFGNGDLVSDKGASGAIGNSITLTGEKITNLVTIGTWDSTAGNITAYIWSGITQNSTSEGSEIIVAQSDTWDFASHGGGEFPPNNPNNYYELMVFNFSSPVSLTGDYVIGYKWSNIDSFGNSIGSRDSLAGGNSIFRSDGCTVTEIGASDTWSSCHTELSFPIRNLSMDITIEEDVTNVDTGTGIQTSNLVVHHTFDSSEIEGGIGLNAGTLGGGADAYYLYDSASDDYTGDWYLSDYILNNLAQLNDAHINGFNSTTGTGTVVQLGNFHNRDQWNFLHDDMTNEYAISFWIKGNLDEEFPIPIISTFTETNGLVLSFDGGIPNLFIGQDDFGENYIPIEDAQFSGLSLPDDGNFHLFTLSIEKSNVTSTAQACIDLTCDTVDRDEPFLTSILADRPFTIGEDHNTRAHAVHFEDGRSYSEFQMDDLCIWSNAILSSSERSTLYNSGNGQPCATVVEGGGRGTDGPTLVDPGTYIIQETIPAGWSLTTATCNDGSSSFSVDTVSGIVIDSDDRIECTFENAFVASISDTDGDGIDDEVDTLPNTFSNDFSDVSLGGTSSGTIVIKGDQTLTITEESNPDGVRISANISGGLLSATVDACGGLSVIILTPGDNIVVTCGSATIDVTNGPIEITFISSQGIQATTTLTTGNSITFDQDTFSFVAPSTNVDPIVVIIEGKQIIINPSQAVNVLLSNKNSFIKQGELNTNEGANTMMRVRDNGNNRAMVSFDQNEILAAAQERTLSSATLRLYIEENGNNWGPDGRTIDIHRLLDDWTEGNGFNDKPKNMPLSQFNELKTRGDGFGVTWKCATDTEINNQQTDCNPEWNGATFNLSPIDTITIFKDNPPTGTIKTVGWIEFDVTSDLQTFLSDAEQNYGWLVKKTEEGAPGLVEFTSGESDTKMPELVLVFD